MSARRAPFLSTLYGLGALIINHPGKKVGICLTTVIPNDGCQHGAEFHGRPSRWDGPSWRRRPQYGTWHASQSSTGRTRRDASPVRRWPYGCVSSGRSGQSRFNGRIASGCKSPRACWFTAPEPHTAADAPAASTVSAMYVSSFHFPSLFNWPVAYLILHVLTLLLASVNSNPNAVAAIRQQQMLQQQQQARQMMAQQAFQNNLQQGGMPMAMQLNPSQLHQLRQQASRMGPVRSRLISMLSFR